MQHHIITVGISLLTNYRSKHNDGLPKEEQIDRKVVLGRSLEVKKFLAENPRAASAEINTLEAKTDFLRGDKSFSVSLVYSETDEGKTAASHLEDFLKEKNIRSTSLVLRDMTIPANEGGEPDAKRKAAEEGLREFRRRIADHVQRLKKQTPEPDILFCASGGFKSEIAVFYGLGKELGLPVYYMHEIYNIAIELP